jgi:hypothetical protein
MHGPGEANEQLVLALPHDEVQDNAQDWEYTVLTTNVPHDLAPIGQLYATAAAARTGSTS